MTLTVVRGPDSGLKQSFVAERVTIGRRAGDLVLRDRETSGRHATIERRPDGRFVVRDLGSTNGTFLDGKRIGEADIASGQQLRCGANWILFTAAVTGGPIAEDATRDDLQPAVIAPPYETAPPLAPPSAPSVGPDWALPPAAPPSAPSVGPDWALPPAAPPSAPSVGRDETVPPPSALPAGPDETVPPPLALPSPAEAPPAEPTPLDGPIEPDDLEPFDMPSAGDLLLPPEPAESPAPAPAGLPPAERQAPPRTGLTRHAEPAAPQGPPQSAAAPLPPPPIESPRWDLGDALPDLELPAAETTVPLAAAPSPAPSPTTSPSVAPDPAPAPAPAGPPAGVERSAFGVYLVCERGPNRGQVFPIQVRVTVIGRSQTDVVLDDPDISRRHAALEIAGRGRHELRDLQSTNGTLLNGRKVASEPVADNDKIRLGSTTLKLVVGELRLATVLESLDPA